jgi:hypothetical protein
VIGIGSPKGTRPHHRRPAHAGELERLVDELRETRDRLQARGTELLGRARHAEERWGAYREAARRLAGALGAHLGQARAAAPPPAPSVPGSGLDLTRSHDLGRVADALEELAAASRKGTTAELRAAFGNLRCPFCKRRDELEVTTWIRVTDGRLDTDGPLSPAHPGGAWVEGGA